MQIELNFEARNAHAADLALSLLTACGADIQAQHRGKPDYNAPDGCSSDDVAVAVRVSGPHSLADARTMAFTQALCLAQDCIALLADGMGELVGPEAAKWGAFDPERFKSA